MRGIYLRTDPNGVHYVGLSCDIERRWKEEDREAMHPTKTHENDLYFALKFYGPKNFKNKILEEIPYDESKTIHENIKILSEREKYWINEYDSYYNGYNKTRGGSGVATSQFEQEKFFEENKEKILQAINNGITKELFIKEFKLNGAYYDTLRTFSDVKANSFEYKEKNHKLNKGQQIWYNKKKNRNKKARKLKENQMEVIQWVEFDKAIFNLSYAQGGNNKKTTFKEYERHFGLMIENKIYYGENHFVWVNAKGTIIRKRIPFKHTPEWANEFMLEKAKSFLQG